MNRIIFIVTLFVGLGLFIPDIRAESNLPLIIAMVKAENSSPSVESILNSVLEMNENGIAFPTRKELKVKDPRFQNSSSNALQYCRDDELGIRLLCDPGWFLRAEKEALILIISQSPRVTLEIARLDKKMKTLGQLNTFYFENKGHYQKGFAIENIQEERFRAVKVKAFSKDFPLIRIVDYYFLQEENLYGLFFSVEPKEEWDNYKHLFQEIVHSLVFL